MRQVAVELWRDTTAALRLFTVPSFRSRQDPARLARATLLFPLVGVLVGTGLAAWDAMVARLVTQPMRAALVVAAWTALAGGMGVRGVARAVAGHANAGDGMTRFVGMLAVAILVAGKVVALVSVAPALVARALILAPVLGRWSVVVLAYGARPIRTARAAALPLARVTFREFGWSSVMAFAIALSLADAIGLIFVIAAAVTATGIRVGAYARRGEMSSDVLCAGIEVVELVVLGAATLLSGAVATA